MTSALPTTSEPATVAGPEKALELSKIGSDSMADLCAKYPERFPGFIATAPITAGAEKSLQAKIPGAANQPHKIIRNAGHFIQEDAGEELADELIKWLL